MRTCCIQATDVFRPSFSDLMLLPNCDHDAASLDCLRCMRDVAMQHGGSASTQSEFELDHDR